MNNCIIFNPDTSTREEQSLPVFLFIVFPKIKRHFKRKISLIWLDDHSRSLNSKTTKQVLYWKM